jgi:hypothetical protein
MWGFEGKSLSADPDTLAGYGKNAATIAINFQEDVFGPAKLISGAGVDNSISTGQYPEGARAQYLCSRNAGEMLQFLGDAYQTCLALASSALIIGDLLKKADLDGKAMVNAVNWTLVRPGAKKPDGLPYYIDGSTIEGQEKEVPAGKSFEHPESDKLIGQAMQGDNIVYIYRTASGTIRTIENGSRGYIETGYKKDGTTKVFQTTSDSDGRIVTKSYEKDGKTLKGTTTQFTITTTASATPHLHDTVERTESVDADGNLTGSTVKYTRTTAYNDGTASREQYTETTDDEGKTKTTDIRHITRQPSAVTGEEFNEVTREKLNETQKQLGNG